MRNLTLVLICILGGACKLLPSPAQHFEHLQAQRTAAIDAASSN